MSSPCRKEYDVLILGAGASGLCCALAAARRGLKTLLLDRADKAGVKLALSGGGKANLTNKRLSPEDYYGQNPDFCRSALARLNPAAILDFLERHGLAWEEREHGQVFCQGPARKLRDLLVNLCQEAGCDFALGEAVRQAALRRAGPGRFVVRTAKGQWLGDNLVLATGGPAWPQCGASGIGYALARRFGHAIVPVRPALVGLAMPPAWPLGDLQGISLPVTIRLPIHPGAGEFTAARSLALLFTHQGISGPAALQTSLYWEPGLPLRIDFLPDQPIEEALQAPGAGKLLCRNLLRRLLPDRLAEGLVPGSLAGKKCAELSRQDRNALASALHAHQVIPMKSLGFSRAEVAAGGVDTREVSSTSMESKKVAGLYFCGEVLDVTGRLGGCNLHWAFASGKAAGERVGLGNNTLPKEDV